MPPSPHGYDGNVVNEALPQLFPAWFVGSWFIHPTLCYPKDLSEASAAVIRTRLGNLSAPAARADKATLGSLSAYVGAELVGR